MGINFDILRPEDIANYAAKCLPYLVPGIILLVASVIMIFVTKNWMTAKRKLTRSTAWVAMGLALLLGIRGIIFGPLFESINLVMTQTKGMSEETKSAGEALNVRIAEEGIVLLKNDDSMLPMEAGKVNVFGWASVSPCYGGTGSGAVDTSTATTLLSGLSDAGYEVNSELTDFYTAYGTERGGNSLGGNTDWTLREPAVSSYPKELLENAKSYSDTALIVLARVGGEGEDLPKDMKNANYDTASEGAGHEGDFEAGMHYLELSATEKELVDTVCSDYENVAVIYNSGNPFELGWVEKYDSIKAVLNIAGPGQNGFKALGEVLNGTVNPSGHLTDTYVYDLTKTPSFNNIGSFYYDNVEEFYDKDKDKSFNGMSFDKVSFVNYVESIYVGYKFYETAAEEGLITYEDEVQYPFGYGLSYTEFEQKMENFSADGENVSFDVVVTNTGDTAGKDAVEVYYTPPYTNGGIEKSSVNLVDFAKTIELAPGESEKISFTIPKENMASFDVDGKGCYVLEKGVYSLSIRSDSHTVLDKEDFTIDKDIVYDGDNPRSTDNIAAQTALDYAAGDVTYLSRKDHFSNYKEATAAPASFSMSDEIKAAFVNNDNYNISEHNSPEDKMPQTGKDNGVKLTSLAGKDYEDPLWEDLLDELTIEEMQMLSAKAGFSTIAIESIGKPETSEVDGPSGLHSFFNPAKKGNSYCAPVMLAATWNPELSEEYGSQIGKEANEVDVTGWYGPGMNIHRSAFSGRNYEYYSEDSVLSGKMAAASVKKAQESGVYCMMKHFALNDQEDNRNNQLCTWVDEQAARENYLRAFEIAVKDGHATSMMSAFNYVGPVWAGASPALTTTILRDEWGFRGFILTDAAMEGYNYINGDQMIRGGGDGVLNPDATEDTTVHDLESATSIQNLRRAAHNILYTVANSSAISQDNGASKTPQWIISFYLCFVFILLLLAGLEVIAFMRYKKRNESVKK